jgi:hypothetical protein
MTEMGSKQTSAGVLCRAHCTLDSGENWQASQGTGMSARDVLMGSNGSQEDTVRISDPANRDGVCDPDEIVNICQVINRLYTRVHLSHPFILLKWSQSCLIRRIVKIKDTQKTLYFQMFLILATFLCIYAEG